MKNGRAITALPVLLERNDNMIKFGLDLASWILGLSGIEETKAQGIVDIIRMFF